MKFRLDKRQVLSLTLYLLPGLMFGAAFYYLYHHFSISQIQAFIYSFGFAAAGMFILLFTVRTFFIFAPYYVMLILGGNLFGKEFGLLYNFIAVVLSASLAYILSRIIRTTIQNRFHFERHQSYIDLIRKHGFKILIFMRLAIIFPFDVLNYAAGLAGMRYRDFILANIIGVIPEVCFLTYFGQSLKAPRSLQFLILSLILCLVLILGFRYHKPLRQRLRSFH